jgi:hypothetical protein
MGDAVLIPCLLSRSRRVGRGFSGWVHWRGPPREIAARARASRRLHRFCAQLEQRERVRGWVALGPAIMGSIGSECRRGRWRPFRRFVWRYPVHSTTQRYESDLGFPPYDVNPVVLGFLYCYFILYFRFVANFAKCPRILLVNTTTSFFALISSAAVSSLPQS